jgi:hypothetical protein
MNIDRFILALLGFCPVAVVLRKFGIKPGAVV